MSVQRLFGSLVLGMMLCMWPAAWLHASQVGGKFDDPVRLANTLLADEVVDVERAGADLALAQEALAQAEAEGASEEELAALRDEVTAAEADLAEARLRFETETGIVPDQVDALSDAQLVDLNRSLNNALASGLIVDIDSDDLQRLLDAELSGHDVQSFTKAFEEEAKFTAHAERFAALDDPKFDAKAERFLAKAESQKEKFLGKIDAFDETDAIAVSESRAMAREAVRDLGRAAFRDHARGHAPAEVRKAARRAAREAAGKADRGRGKGHGRGPKHK